jgi:hypothetical protein
MPTPKYKVRPDTGELQEYLFEYNGILALKNFVARVDGERLILHSAEDMNFSILDALVSEVEINGVVYDNADAAQQALQRLTFNTNRPVIMTQRERELLLGALQSGNYVGTAADLKSLIDGKVDKEAGKGLSTNDFTNAYKQKLDTLEDYDIELDENTTELRFKKGSNVVRRISLMFLDDEGTKLVYNKPEKTLELRDKRNNLLTSIPVSHFVSNIPDGIVVQNGKIKLMAGNNVIFENAFSYNDLADKPDLNFAPASHRHNWDDIDGKPEIATYKTITDAHKFLDKDGAIHFGSGSGIANAPGSSYYEMLGLTHSSKGWGFIIAKNLDEDDSTLYIKQFIEGQAKDWFKLTGNIFKKEENTSYGLVTKSENPMLIKEVFLDKEDGSKTNLWSQENNLNVGSKNRGGYTRVKASGYELPNGTNKQILLGNGESKFLGYGQHQEIDLKGFPEDKYFIVYASITASDRCKFRIHNALDGKSKPNWSTHGNGFTIQLEFEQTGGGWGTANLAEKINHYSYDWSNAHPAMFVGQHTQSSTSFVYLRGGGVYQFYSWSMNGSQITWENPREINGNFKDGLPYSRDWDANLEIVPNVDISKGIVVGSDREASFYWSNNTVFVIDNCRIDLINIESLSSVSFRKTFSGGNVNLVCTGKQIIYTGDNAFNGGDGSTAVVSIWNNKCYIDIRNV